MGMERTGGGGEKGCEFDDILGYSEGYELVGIRDMRTIDLKMEYYGEFI
jgi:hypothetical protein